MFELIAVWLALTGGLAVHLVFCLLVALIWRASSRRAEFWPPSRRAAFLFFLGILPTLVAIFCVGALFIPAFLKHEPRATGEVITFPMGLLAALSLYGIGLACWRSCARLIVTRRLLRNWLKHAVPIRMNNISVPAFRFAHAFPVIAIVGAIRPNLFIADGVFAALDPGEIAAALAHESGHLAARDNLKRELLCWCRDLLGFLPSRGTLDRAWAEAAELAADECAAGRDGACALDLASTLVKVARMAPDGLKPATLAGAALVAHDSGRIRMRVLRLTQLASDAESRPGPERRLSRLTLAASISGVALALFLILRNSELLLAVHSALEGVVSALQ
jgi:Zn-dependent protease with chaperone function